ncbi:putative 2OG-Fe(II) oxygenase [Candidatus Pelagibacter communis]|uniref:putative 2OG-Fe(II) oxygenase n=1 Tax=Pelagibacter ubique TaxID=198252 RepID=UPI00094DE3CF|nr:putative 2OG-Fe(II) oxygenase [Candidatus Pelagibacter ubique]|tara:strand:- start:2932 stop:3522 length:591 start_codon:yes stop_codon:yes gene_type:complete
MKNIKPFGPSVGKTRLSKKFFDTLNKEFEKKSKFKKIDYGPKLASQINKEVKISSKFIKDNLEKELKKIIIKFLSNENIKNIKKVKILNLWVVRQFKGEYNPIHYHEGDLSGVGYLKLPRKMTTNKMVKNKKIKTNGTIDFINGQRGFLSKSIYNVIPKIGDMYLFPNYLMHTAYPFNVEGERRSFSFNAKLVLKK